MLAWTIYLSFSGGVALFLVKRENAHGARVIALLTSLAGLLVAVAGALQFDPKAGVATVTRVAWIPSLGIEYHLAVDGISIVLLLLTGLAAVVGVLFSWNVEQRAREFFAFYLALIGGVYGVFLSFDLFLLFVFYELAIVPKYFLIAIWGSTRREYGAMKLALYSFVGSAMVLIGLLAAYVLAGAHTFNVLELAQTPFSREFQMRVFPLVFVGFAILAGLWPFHTWAPTGHVAAPTAASMLLAGVIMKLGAYGCLRVAMTLFPMGLHDWEQPFLGFGSWRDVFGALGVAGIVYGAMVALVQKDLKFVIGYSSVSHMGFVIVGLMTLTAVGLNGAVLQMFSHGVIAGLLFGVVGRMLYDRTHTRVLDELETMRLNRALPFAAGTFVIAGLASMGMPGFSGFVAEFQILIGAWKAFPTLAVLGGLGVLIGVAYTLRAIQKAFFPDAAADLALANKPLAMESSRVSAAGSGLLAPSVLLAGSEGPLAGSGSPGPSAHSSSEHGPQGSGLEPITVPERVGAVILIATTLLLGLYPRLLLDLIEPAVQSPLFENLLKGGGR